MESSQSFPKIAILDGGSQYTQLIERSSRELGIRTMVLEPKRMKKLLKARPDLRAVIISGSGRSVGEKNAPQIPEKIFQLGVPILGICYGMQLIAHHFGGRLGSVQGHREYGPAQIQVDRKSLLFAGLNRSQKVWASHGDSVLSAPKGFRITARNQQGGISAMEDESRQIYCTLFHPEVSHTQHGKLMLRNFLFPIAGCERDWYPSEMVEEIRSNVLAQMGRRRKAVLGFSGGVDSTTLATILSPVMGRGLLCVVIDGGQLREKELQEIRRNAKLARARLVVINARKQFGKALRNIRDSEKKRKAFKRIYAQTLIRAARRFRCQVVIQGSLATDMIESGVLGGELIKSHHNVGLKLPKGWLGLHPLGHLFKYEVRALARQLGLPESVWRRQPSPGPGLFIRVVNLGVTDERLNLLRWADARVREILIRHKVEHKASQVVVSYHGRLVGVKGDARSYGAHIQVRGLKTIDFMTGSGVRYPVRVKREIETTLSQHRGIVGVTWNEMDKPPCTTEPE